MLSASHNGLATRILDRADLRLNDQMIEAIVAADHADDVNLGDVRHSDAIVKRGVHDLPFAVG